MLYSPGYSGEGLVTIPILPQEDGTSQQAGMILLQWSAAEHHEVTVAWLKGQSRTIVTLKT